MGEQKNLYPLPSFVTSSTIIVNFSVTNRIPRLHIWCQLIWKYNNSLNVCDRKLLEVDEVVALNSETAGTVVARPMDILQAARVAVIASQDTTQGTDRFEGTESSASITPMGSITDLEMLCNKKAPLCSQHSSETSLLHARSCQILGLTLQVKNLYEKIDDLSANQQTAQLRSSASLATKVTVPAAASFRGERFKITVPATKNSNHVKKALKLAARSTKTAAVSIQPTTIERSTKPSLAENSTIPTVAVLSLGQH